jgi:pyruvate kinase
MRSTKIIATVGPASRAEHMLQGLVEAGVDTFRINCSYLESHEVLELIQHIRVATPDVGILVDVQGPKLRTGDSHYTFVEGTEIELTPDMFGFDLHEIGIQSGERVLVADGQIELWITAIRGGDITARVLVGGECAPHRGVNFPDTDVKVSALNDKDYGDITAAKQGGAEWIALSFVRDTAIIEEVRSIVGDEPRIIAKIERRQALMNLEAITRAADGVMAARGDLGAELSFEEVPNMQQRIANLAMVEGKVSICATEMMESMRTNHRPTRAEVADVAGAVREGFSAVMLSAETATGYDPINAVTAMARICDANETHDGAKSFADAHPTESAVGAATAALAKRTGAASIIALTYSGYSSEILSACRPAARIIAATPSPEVARRLRLYWGVTPLVCLRNIDMAVAVDDAFNAAVDEGLVQSNELVVVCASRENVRSAADTIWVHNA